MKANKLKKVFAVTTLAAAMSVTAFAATNPAAPTGGVTNPATGEGQSQIQQENNTTAGSANSGGSDTPKAPPNDTANPNISDSVKDCVLEENRDAALTNVIEIINAQPKVDDLFNSKSEASKGCFAASSQVINLAMEIPTFSPSWSNLGSIIKANIMKMIAAKQQELINKGCAIADQALLSAMQPIQDYMTKYTGALGGMTGNFGGLDMDAEYDESKGSLWGQVSGQMQGDIDDLKGRLDKDSKAAADIQAQFDRQYQDMLAGMDIPNQTPDFNGNANNGGNTGNSNTAPKGDPVPPIWPDDMRGRSAPAPQAQSQPQAQAPAPRSQFQAPPTTSNNPAATERNTASGSTVPKTSPSTPF